MFRSRARRCFSTLCIIFVISAVSACSNSGTAPPPAVSARLVKPADNGELERWLKAELVKINESGISQRGVIPAQAVSSGYGAYDDTVDRSVIIGENIYAIAHRTVTVAGATGLDIKKVVTLPEGHGYYALFGQVGEL